MESEYFADKLDEIAYKLYLKNIENSMNINPFKFWEFLQLKGLFEQHYIKANIILRKLKLDKLNESR